MIRGSCLCGGVRFEVAGTATLMSSCYCSRCRKAYASPAGTVVVVNRRDFTYLEGRELIVSFHSSPRVNRPFCSRSGSRLPIVEEWDPLVGIPAGLLDDDPGVKNTQHIFVGSKAPWWEIRDDIPQHEEWLPRGDLEARFEDLTRSRGSKPKG